jgi:protease-4
LIFTVVGLFAVLGFVALLWMIAPPGVDVPQGSWLELSFTGDLPEQRGGSDGVVGALAAGQLTGQDVAAALRGVEDDPRIYGILVRPDYFGGSWAQAEEIRAALARIRARGKEVRAQLEFASPVGYYLASACESISIVPEGQLQIVGLRSRLSHVKGTLDKIGVDAQFVAIGEFKSAPEYYQREIASENSRRQSSELLDGIFEHWIGALAASRGVTTDRILALVDEGIFDAEQALAAGLVDVVGDLDEAFAASGAPEAPELVHVYDYAMGLGDQSGSDGNIAVVYVAGTIVSGPSGEGQLGGRFAGSDTVIERLRMAATDPTVGALVLRVDSPGGSAIASDLIYREVRRLQETMPVVVSMGGVAASGGYYVAMSADRVFADATTITGSIGVYMGKMNLSGLYEKLGMSFEELSRGENATVYSDLEPFSDAQRTSIEGRLEGFYERFVTRVAEGRGLEFEMVDEVARGRVWTGTRALGFGLVDESGGVDEAIDAARELAGFDESANIGVRSYQPEPSMFTQLLASALRGSTLLKTQAVIPSMTASLRRSMAQIEDTSLTLDGSVQFHLPWSLRIE